jgi:secondary thiamine-phosphate synthase enzyme
MNVIEVKTQSKEELMDITASVKDICATSEIQEGICHIYVPHTTAGVTINENADPTVKDDILMTLKKIVPNSLPYQHLEGNSPAHVKACLIGPSVNIIVQDGRLSLGTWQGVFFCEFDGPRRRKVFIKSCAY